MKNATTFLEECEEVTAAGRLIMSSIDRKARIVTKQQRANCTVTDKEHVSRTISSHDLLDLPDNAQLGVNRSLPAPNTDRGPCKKLVGGGFKNVSLQETGRRPVVLVHGLPYL